MGVGSPQAGLGTKHAGPKVSERLMQAYFVHAAWADQTAVAVPAVDIADEQAAAKTFAGAGAAAAAAAAGFDLAAAAAADTHIATLLVLQLHSIDSA